MNKNLLFAIVCLVTLGSCSTAYNSGQTPDDVYFSPERKVEKSYAREKTNDRYYTRDFEERQIRMNAYDPRWRYLDDTYSYNHNYNPYSYGYNYGYYYNPYYYPAPVFFPGVVVVNPKNTVPRMTNLSSYSSKGATTVDAKTGATLYRYNNKNSNFNNGSTTNGRTVIVPSSNNGYNKSSSISESRRSSSDNNSRTYSPSNNNSNNTSTRSSTPSSSSQSSGSSVPRNSRGQ